MARMPMCESNILALLNTRLDTWPPEPIEASKPFKAQTRRVIKMFGTDLGLPLGRIRIDEQGYLWDERGERDDGLVLTLQDRQCHIRYKPGLVYAVSETLRGEYNPEDGGDTSTTYAADGALVSGPDGCYLHWPYKNSGVPSMLMKAKYARLWLKVVSARAERVQDITEEDAQLEGVDAHSDSMVECEWPHRGEFYTLWDTLHPKPPYNWDSNPWVIRYEFMRVARPEA